MPDFPEEAAPREWSDPPLPWLWGGGIRGTMMSRGSSADGWVAREAPVNWDLREPAGGDVGEGHSLQREQPVQGALRRDCVAFPGA